MKEWWKEWVEKKETWCRYVGRHNREGKKRDHKHKIVRDEKQRSAEGCLMWFG